MNEPICDIEEGFDDDADEYNYDLYDSLDWDEDPRSLTDRPSRFVTRHILPGLHPLIEEIRAKNGSAKIGEEYDALCAASGLSRSHISRNSVRKAARLLTTTKDKYGIDMKETEANIALTKDQMRSLFSLGMDCDDASYHYNQKYGRDIPAYTTDDILRKLPQEITVNGIRHRIYFTIRSVGGKPEYQASYNFADEDGKMRSSLMNVWKSDSFLTLLYGILIWCITQKHLPL